MDLGSLLLGLALLAIVVFLVARPLIERRGVRERAVSETDQLIAERESVLAALRDLDFDHAMGKTSDEDYAPQRASLVAQGAEVLKKLDALGTGGQGNGDEIERLVATRRKTRPAGAPRDEVEARIAMRRGQKVPSAGDCPHCAAPIQAGDQYCGKCGQALPSCPQCGKPHALADKFCGKCGTKLPATGGETSQIEVTG